MHQYTKAFVSQFLEYDPVSGLLVWKHRTAEMFRTQGSMRAASIAAQWNTRYAGTQAGAKTANGYVSLGIFKKRFYAHQAAVLLMTGSWPTEDVDHINRDKSDNRWENLRVASRAQNNTNSKLRKDSSTGLKGVSFHKRKGKWEAKICIEGKQTRLGYFTCPNEAHKAYVEASKKYFGEFARAA